MWVIRLMRDEHCVLRGSRVKLGQRVSCPCDSPQSSRAPLPSICHGLSCLYLQHRAGGPGPPSFLQSLSLLEALGLMPQGGRTTHSCQTGLPPDVSGAANIQSRGTREEKLGHSPIPSRLALVICTVFVHTSPLTGWGTLSRHLNFVDSFFIWGTWITILDLFNAQKHC